LHLTAQKADTRTTISSMGKKVTPVPTAADGSFAVSKASAVRLSVPPARFVKQAIHRLDKVACGASAGLGDGLR
jgi:hypothetical protein